MSLEDFIETDETVIEDNYKKFVGNKHTSGEIIGDVVYPHTDNPKLNSKHIASIQLAMFGYSVRQDYGIGDYTFSIRASSNSLNLSPLFIEIDDMTLSKARSLAETDGYLLMLESGDSLDQAAVVNVIDGSNNSYNSLLYSDYDCHSIVNQFKTVAYLDSNQEQFVPRCNDIHVEKFKRLANILLSMDNMYTDKSIDDISQKISTASNSYTYDDVQKVLSELGFIV